MRFVSSCQVTLLKHEKSGKYNAILFDIGFVGVGSLQVAEGEVRCFLMSDCIRNVQDLSAGSRGYVSMTSLGTTGLFGNQMFQYLYVKFYALRHCLTAAFPLGKATTFLASRIRLALGLTSQN